MYPSLTPWLISEFDLEDYSRNEKISEKLFGQKPNWLSNKISIWTVVLSVFATLQIPIKTGLCFRTVH
jgi:hypothetical protein